jgi:hypothetical protein
MAMGIHFFVHVMYGYEEVKLNFYLILCNLYNGINHLWDHGYNRRNVCSLTFFVCINFVMAHKSRYLKSINHKIVLWNTNRPRRLYFTIVPFYFAYCCFLSIGRNSYIRRTLIDDSLLKRCMHTQLKSNYPWVRLQSFSNSTSLVKRTIEILPSGVGDFPILYFPRC